MELKSNHSSPVLTDPVPINKSRLGIHSNLLSSGKYITIPIKKPGKVDDVWSNGWLDAMKSSSPPRKKFIKDINFEVSADDIDLSYCSWLVCINLIYLIYKHMWNFHTFHCVEFAYSYVLQLCWLCRLNIHLHLNVLRKLPKMPRTRK